MWGAHRAHEPSGTKCCTYQDGIHHSAAVADNSANDNPRPYHSCAASDNDAVQTTNSAHNVRLFLHDRFWDAASVKQGKRHSLSWQAPTLSLRGGSSTAGSLAAGSCRPFQRLSTVSKKCSWWRARESPDFCAMLDFLELLQDTRRRSRTPPSMNSSRSVQHSPALSRDFPRLRGPPRIRGRGSAQNSRHGFFREEQNHGEHGVVQWLMGWEAFFDGHMSIRHDAALPRPHGSCLREPQRADVRRKDLDSSQTTGDGRQREASLDHSRIVDTCSAR